MVDLLRKYFVLAISLFALTTAIVLRVWAANICCGLLCPWYFVFCGLIISLPILIIISLIQIIKQRTRWQMVNVALIVIILLVLFVAPPSSQTEEMHFRSNKEKYEKAVTYIIDNLANYTNGYNHFPQRKFLPEEFQGLSRCSSGVQVDSSSDFTQVFFTNTIDAYSVTGYLYSSDDTIHQSSFIWSVELENVCRKVEDHWYFCDYRD